MMIKFFKMYLSLYLRGLDFFRCFLTSFEDSIDFFGFILRLKLKNYLFEMFKLVGFKYWYKLMV